MAMNPPKASLTNLFLLVLKGEGKGRNQILVYLTNLPFTVDQNTNTQEQERGKLFSDLYRDACSTLYRLAPGLKFLVWLGPEGVLTQLPPRPWPGVPSGPVYDGCVRD